MENIVIIGAGIIGACLAFNLSRCGAAVTVIDAGLPASAASGRSFGWINASFSLSADHFALRVAGMAAHLRLASLLPGHHRSVGCLWWEETGASFDATAQTLHAAGYPLRHVSRAEIARLEPALKTPPERALLFPAEGWVDPVALTRALLAASGATVLTGLTAQVQAKGGRVTGVTTPLGPLAADQVIVAAGLGTPALLAPLGLTLPMLHRPGLLLRTAPVDLRLGHILAAAEQELRQDDHGRLVAPAAAFHQSDDGHDLRAPLDQAAQALDRIGAMLGLSGVRAEAIIHAERPVPGDGLPVIGRALPGLWLAVMHSGVTLAAIVGEGLATEVLGQGEKALFAPFRPARFL